MYILVLKDDKEALHYDDYDYDDMLEYIRDEGLWNNFIVLMQTGTDMIGTTTWVDFSSDAYDNAQSLDEDRANEAAAERMEAPIVL